MALIALTCYQPYNIGGQSLACHLFKHTPDEVLLGFPKLGTETQDWLSLLWGKPLTLSSFTLTFQFSLAPGMLPWHCPWQVVRMEFQWEEWLYVGSIYWPAVRMLAVCVGQTRYRWGQRLSCECLVTVCDVCPNNVDSYPGNIKVYTSSAKMCTKTAPSAFIIPKFNFEVYWSETCTLSEAPPTLWLRRGGSRGGA